MAIFPLESKPKPKCTVKGLELKEFFKKKKVISIGHVKWYKKYPHKPPCWGWRVGSEHTFIFSLQRTPLHDVIPPTGSPTLWWCTQLPVKIQFKTMFLCLALATWCSYLVSTSLVPVLLFYSFIHSQIFEFLSFAQSFSSRSYNLRQGLSWHYGYLKLDRFCSAGWGLSSALQNTSQHPWLLPTSTQ